MRGVGARVGVGVVTAALFLATPAIAGSRSYSGKVDPGGTVSFTGKTHGHRVVKVKNFVFKDVPASCNEPGPYLADISNNPLPRMPVNALHRFHGRFKIPGTNDRVRVRGAFRHHGRRAHGRLRLTGDYSGATNCDTGVRRWKAHR